MDLLTFFGYYNPLRTVWYIQAGTVDPNGLFTNTTQASAVLINIRKNDGTTGKVLVTARHGLCKILSRNPVTYGSVLPEFRAWAPGWNLSKTPITVSYSELSPDRNLDLSNLSDLAFLELPENQQGFEEAQLAENFQVRPRKRVRIIGFNGGLDPADDGFDIEAFDSRNWDFINVDEGTRRAFLRNGIGGGAPGCSGGGIFLPFSIFRQPNLLGIYRGMEGMNHLFMPTTWIREHLGTLDCKVLNRDWRRSRIIRVLSWLLIGAASALIISDLTSPFTPLWLFGFASAIAVAVLPLHLLGREPKTTIPYQDNTKTRRRKVDLIAVAVTFAITTLWKSSQSTLIYFHSTGNVEFVGCKPSTSMEAARQVSFSDQERLEPSFEGERLVVEWTHNKDPRGYSFRTYPDRNNDSYYYEYRGRDFEKIGTWTLATHFVAHRNED